MKILIDDGLASLSALSGIGHQGINLGNALSRITDCKITNYRYLKNIPRVARRFAYMYLANREIRSRQYDLIHYQNYFVPGTSGTCKKLVTIHDMGSYRYPDTISTSYRRYLQYIILNATKRADAIITPSQFSRDELLSLFNTIDPNRVVVCKNGLRDIFMNKNSPQNIILPPGVEPFSFFFFIGVLTKRKNLKFLLEAFLKAKRDGIIGRDTLLILAGKEAWDTSEIRPLLKKSSGIKLLGYISDQQLLAMYKYCKAFIFPSLYEGFGIPVIEAMSQRVPILASDIAPNRELNAAHGYQMNLFSINDNRELLHLFHQFDKDQGSNRVEINYGDLSSYSFDQVARQHLTIYEQFS